MRVNLLIRMYPKIYQGVLCIALLKTLPLPKICLHKWCYISPSVWSRGRLVPVFNVIFLVNQIFSLREQFINFLGFDTKYDYQRGYDFYKMIFFIANI